MPTTTPNLGLFKRDPLTEGNHYFNIQEQINDPLDVIDDKVGGELVAKPPHSVTLTNGTQIVEASRTSRFQNIRMQGRTLVNLLGRDGNCEDTSKWAKGGSGEVLVSNTQRKYGLNSLKCTSSSNQAIFYKDINNLSLSSYYVLIAEVYLEDYVAGYFGMHYTDYGSWNNIVPASADTTKLNQWQLLKLKFTGATSNRIAFGALYASSNGAAYVDGIRLYEISQDEYNALDTMTPEQIFAKYPYVDDMKHVNAVHITNWGKNLLPPFSEWTRNANSIITDDYDLLLNATGADQNSYYELTVLPNTKYFMSRAEGSFIVRYYDANGNHITSGGNPVSTSQVNNVEMTTPSNCVKMRIQTYQNTAGTFSFSKPMLNLGTEALPFEPQLQFYLYLPDVNLRSNVDGSVADQLYTDGEGKPRAVRRFREMVLDGSLDWMFLEDYAGFKTVSVTNGLGSNYLLGSLINSVKHDGKILNNFSSVTSGPDRLNASGLNHINVSISDDDSGWGETYTPTAEEIKAYFNGWKMYVHGDPDYAPYNGTGTKAWVDRTKTYTVTTVPDSFPASIYTPYRIIYQLSQSVDEAVTFEGELMLQDGANQIEVGTGVVVREAANPIFTGGSWYINTIGVPATWLKNRASEFIRIYRNADADGKWDLLFDNGASSSAGPVRARIPDEKFGPSAAYSVTYLALDTCTLGIAPLSISGTYTSNIKETIDDLTRGFTEAKTQLSVLQNTKAQKHQPVWIAPTLINGWVNFGSNYSPVGYMKDELGFVHLQGKVKDGTLGQTIFRLPIGYRPSTALVFAVISNAGSTDILGRIQIASNGVVAVLNIGGNTYVSLDGISFRAEH